MYSSKLIFVLVLDFDNVNKLKWFWLMSQLHSDQITVMQHVLLS